MFVAKIVIFLCFLNCFIKIMRIFVCKYWFGILLYSDNRLFNMN